MPAAVVAAVPRNELRLLWTDVSHGRTAGRTKEVLQSAMHGPIPSEVEGREAGAGLVELGQRKQGSMSNDAAVRVFPKPERRILNRVMMGRRDDSREVMFHNKLAGIDQRAVLSLLADGIIRIRSAGDDYTVITLTNDGLTTWRQYLRQHREERAARKATQENG